MIYLLYGKEPYCIKNEIKKLTKANEPLGVVYFDELNDDVFAECSMYNMFTPSKSVVVELEKLPSQDGFLKYAKKPVSTTDLIITVENLDKRSGIVKKIQSMPEGVVKEFSKVDEQTFCKLVNKLASSLGSTFDKGMDQYLYQYSGYAIDDNVNLYGINIAVKQLCFAATGTITKDIIESLVEKSETVKSFELTKILMEGNSKKLFEVAQHLLDEKENPIAMLSLILRTFRLYYKCSILEGKTESKAKLIGVPAYQLAGAYKYETKVVSSVMDELQGGVNAIKSGGDQKVIFKMTLAKCCLILGGT